MSALHQCHFCATVRPESEMRLTLGRWVCAGFVAAAYCRAWQNPVSVSPDALRRPEPNRKPGGAR